FAALFILIMAVFIYFSVVDTAKDLGRWETYLRFSDLWGSSRGFTWKRTMIMYLQHYNIFQKLFGYMIQGLLCSPQPISTPVVFVVMALALSCQKNIKVGKKV
ncbi:MAG: hypothetical protein II799_01920, partial [Lachnospiraceae bacterium]|nr:hypothetical protein [Lachnospiraceae bacterium]